MHQILMHKSIRVEAGWTVDAAPYTDELRDARKSEVGFGSVPAHASLLYELLAVNAPL